MSYERWRENFSVAARDYWTDEREDELLGGKELLLTPRRAPHVLRAIGILHRDATMPPRQRRKFFQLNHMLRLLEAPLREFDDLGQSLRIVDAGCGLGYVTVALGWVLQHVHERPAEIIGVDRRAALVEECNETVATIGLDDTVRFVADDVDAFDPGHFRGSPDSIDMVIGLHACDTATDDAIVLGERNGAEVIAVAPCCQAELARTWANDPSPTGAFEDVWRTPHLRREMAATLTDTFRQLLLEAAGYEAKAVEFVAAEHTPKNTLIRARKSAFQEQGDSQPYHDLVAATGGHGIALASRLGLDRAEGG